MARARSGGNGAVVAMIAFLAMALIFAILSLVFYIQKGKQVEIASEAESNLKKFVTNSEKNRDEVQAYLGNRGAGSVIGQLLGEKDQLKAEFDKANSKIADLTTDLKAANARLADAESAATKFRKQASNAAAEQSQVKADYVKAEKELTNTVKVQASDAAAQVSRIKEMGDQLSSQMKESRAEMQKQIREITIELEKVKAERSRLQAELNAGKDNGKLKFDITEADGNITSDVQNGNVVYINRGSKDRIVRGMTFEVFDADELVKLNEYKEVRGKATIEIIKIDKTSSLGRVVRVSHSKSVTPGDQIVNAVYSPYAPQKFYIYGDFDLSNSGKATREAKKQVETLINRWGGKIVTKLSPDIDFLVLGQEPEEAPILTEADKQMGPARITEIINARKEYEEYQQLVGEARTLSIPILNQNRFLALIGYYER